MWASILCHSWSDWWSAIQGIALAATAVIAWYQIGALRKDQKAWKTLEACEKYETADSIVSASRRIRDGINSGLIDLQPMNYRVDAMIVLNYLEGIAIAAAQGFYKEDIVREQLEPIANIYAGELLKNNSRALGMGLNWDDFDQLQGLIDRWKKKPLSRVI
jgi:hypothetical protein